jgi:phosphoglycolate phosphatase
MNRMSIKHVIFDLDGTLIDSAPSILASMQVAFNEAGIKPVRPLTSDLIGPPLTVAMNSMLTSATSEKLPILIEGFKRHYDESGYLESQLYEGIFDMLKELKHMGLRLYIATNKRIIPTRKIIEYFGWSTLFDGVYALDHFKPALQNKTSMLQQLRQQMPDISDRSIYVGDRFEDADAAKTNRLCFFWASWGYESTLELETSDCTTVIKKPSQLTKIIHEYLKLSSGHPSTLINNTYLVNNIEFNQLGLH